MSAEGGAKDADAAEDTGTLHPRNYGTAGESNTTAPSRRTTELEHARMEVFTAALCWHHITTHADLGGLATEASDRIHSAVRDYLNTVDLMIGRTHEAR